MYILFGVHMIILNNTTQAIANNNHTTTVHMYVDDVYIRMCVGACICVYMCTCVCICMYVCSLEFDLLIKRSKVQYSADAIMFP